MHHSWLFEYATKLKRRELHLPVECISRADRLNEEVIRCLAEMGCSRLWLGSESGWQRILNAMQRRHSLCSGSAFRLWFFLTHVRG